MFYNITVPVPYLPQTSGSGRLITINHTSFLDPFFLSFALLLDRAFRIIRPITRPDYLLHWWPNRFWKHVDPYFMRIMKRLGSIPRGRRVIAEACRAIEIGHVPMFAFQGHITLDHTMELDRLKPGAALTALRTGAEIVPCAIMILHRSRPWHIRKRVVVAFGQPISVAQDTSPNRGEVTAITRLIRDEIKAQLDIYGTADF